MANDILVYQNWYQRATTPEELPWHRETPPALLEKAVAGHPEKGKALDIGCGAGTFSVYLAKQGFDVTGVDFVEKALGFARERAKREGVKVNFVKSDILQWDPPGKFDLIFDSGCLHSLEDSFNAAYKERLLKWLAPGSDYVLVHFGRRGFFDWRPIGPRRYPRQRVVDLFKPELIEKDFLSTVEKTPFPIGPSIQINTYRFRRA